MNYKLTLQMHVMKISKIFLFAIICLGFYRFVSACYKCSIVEIYDATKHEAYKVLQEKDPKIQLLCKRNTLKHKNNYYVINAYPVNFNEGANTYIQFADLINTEKNNFKQYCINMYEAINLLKSLKLAIPNSEKKTICNDNTIKIVKNPNAVTDGKQTWLKQLKSKDNFLKMINVILTSEQVEKSFELPELKQASLDATKPLKNYCDRLVLIFAKELFKYIRFFNQVAPDINDCNTLEDLNKINNEIYKNVFDNFQQYKIINIFKDEKNIVNKYLHTEYMLYYALSKNNEAINWPIHFVSYLRMCSNCEELWATKTLIEENNYNTVCFFKKGKTIINKKDINASFLQIASPWSNSK